MRSQKENPIPTDPRALVSSGFEAARSRAMNPPPDSISSNWEEQRRRAMDGQVRNLEDIVAMRQKPRNP